MGWFETLRFSSEGKSLCCHRGWLRETGMNSDRDEVRSLQRHYMRPRRKSAVITWDRHEMRRQLNVFHISRTFSILHIGRWPFHYEPNNHGRSSTAGDVFRNVSFCNGVCYTFTAFLPPALQTFAHTRPLTQCSVGTKTRTGPKFFAITCCPGPKLTRSEIFVSVYLPKQVVPVWVQFLYRSHVIR